MNDVVDPSLRLGEQARDYTMFARGSVEVLFEVSRGLVVLGG